ncbi:hypothetical protein S40285_09717 [Stachybotrys chlorohalonatus IBT 40285]|uniref:Uncharacterized protein n=1 Tax=Stachybotrys chlorohalonatus (strain IBT 40285) TaxID=1283841 RepID=A0A084Q880_STAC4|nr:hypothetical protein S40285_09717 [Stachybotrys chlorohalonata IBT 40285]
MHINHFSPKSLNCNRWNLSSTGDDRFWGKGFFRTFWYDLIDPAGFNATLEEAGVDPDWVEFGLDLTVPECAPLELNCRGLKTQYGWPLAREGLVVSNPKDLVAKAFEGVDTLEVKIDSSIQQVGLDLWDGSPTQLFEVLAVPALMVGDAIENMKEIKKIAQQISEAKKKELILLIIESILMLIPLAGPIVGSAGRGGLLAAGIMCAVEAAGGAGLTVHDIIEDHDSAPMAISFMILGAAGPGMTPNGVGNMFSIKRLMDGPTNDKMGTQFKLQNPHVNKINSNTRNRRTF